MRSTLPNVITLYTFILGFIGLTFVKKIRKTHYFNKLMEKFKMKSLKWSHNKQKGNKFTAEISNLQKNYHCIDASAIVTFRDLPLSENTRKGLKESNYKIPTDIQKESIGLALQGRDILGAAETGSGKTLAFLIPILESLYVKKWTRLDGVGAMIITPTRELAFQIFETLKKIGVHHDFSAGLIIGGKDLHFEKDRMDQCNIVICTPGRILHHMDINPLFDCSSLKILVLDEADRCLDMGFEKTMNSIIENLPASRQTLLFSATQTNSVKELARLSLKTPAYVSVHENKKHTTPDTLEQSYIVCQLEDKINLLWSFVKNHRRQKILVFLSSCKQVKYFYSIFCRLRPGIPLLALYGTLHQLRRMNIYKEFCSKQNVVMFATDIAARGLDFPEVNWVVQMDCPEDVNTYIHRAGRTARYRKGGECLLVLLPSEEKAAIKELEQKRVPLNKIEVNETKLMSPVRKIEALLARDPDLKADAQRCFLAYVKSVFLMKNKEIFDVKHLNLARFAASLGLAITPKIRFLSKMQSNYIKIGKEQDTSNQWKNKEINSFECHDHEIDISEQKAKAEEIDGFLTLKRKDHELPVESLTMIEDGSRLSKKQQKKAVLTKVAAAKKVLKKNIVANKKVVFTEDGGVIEQKGKDKFTEEARAYENEELAGIDITKARQILKAEDAFDKKLFRERVKQKHKEAKNKLKQRKEGVEEDLDEGGEFGDIVVRLGVSSDSEDDNEPDLSWIPDPDKIYGREGSKSDCDTEESAEAASAPATERKRRKSTTLKARERKRRKNVEQGDKDLSTGLTLQEDEEIALKILQSSR